MHLSFQHSGYNVSLTKGLRLEGSSGGLLVQPSCSSRALLSRLPRTGQPAFECLHRWRFLNLLGNLCQCSATLTVTKYFLQSKWIFMCSDLCPLPLVLLLGTTENNLSFFQSFPSGVCTFWEDLLRDFTSLGCVTSQEVETLEECLGGLSCAEITATRRQWKESPWLWWAGPV